MLAVINKFSILLILACFLSVVKLEDSKCKTEFILREQDLEELNASVFENCDVTLFESISIENNTIKSIDENTFKGMERLTTLDLSHNHIISIGSSVFNDLENLEELYLDHNELSKIDSGAFNALESLKFLGMNDNFLSIDTAKGCFSELPDHDLLTIDLDKNPMSTSLKKGFLKLKDLKAFLSASENSTIKPGIT
jgi:Leucine-rich repeat (LRR) protein